MLAITVCYSKIGILRDVAGTCVIHWPQMPWLWAQWSSCNYVKFHESVLCHIGLLENHRKSFKQITTLDLDTYSVLTNIVAQSIGKMIFLIVSDSCSPLTSSYLSNLPVQVRLFSKKSLGLINVITRTSAPPKKQDLKWPISKLCYFPSRFPSINCCLYRLKYWCHSEVWAPNEIIWRISTKDIWISSDTGSLPFFLGGDSEAIVKRLFFMDFCCEKYKVAVKRDHERPLWLLNFCRGPFRGEW